MNRIIEFEAGDYGDFKLDCSKLTAAEKTDPNYRAGIRISTTESRFGPSNTVIFETQKQRDTAFDIMNKQIRLNSGKGNSMKEFFGDLSSGARDFVKEHRNIFYTVAVIALVDHFFLGGEFRGRLKALVTKLLDSVTAKVDKLGQ